MKPKDTKFALLDELNQDLSPNQQYSHSKLAGILYTHYLTRHIHTSHLRILANVTHPGFAETNMNVNDIHEPLPVAGYGAECAHGPAEKRTNGREPPARSFATTMEKSGEYLYPPATPERASAQRGAGGVVDEVVEGVG
jgi:NAD(P)-dependent dehydrogenase (short-subunit alcohol dehydrogenase family)